MPAGVPILLTPDEAAARDARDAAAAAERARTDRLRRAQEDAAFLARHHGIAVADAERVIQDVVPADWPSALGGGIAGGRAATELALAFANFACIGGDHGREVNLASACVRGGMTDEVPTYGLAWLRLLTGLEHLRDATDDAGAREAAVWRLHDAAADAIADMTARQGADETRRSPVLRAEMDRFASFLAAAEEEIGLDPGPSVTDMRRRQRANAHPRKDTTFFRDHRDGITAVWRRDAEAWWRERYVAKFGTPPPDDFWMPNASVTGGQVHYRLHSSFDEVDQRAYFDEMEARYRAESGLPAKGEGWVTQAYLARLVAAALPGHEVIREASPSWLAPQRLDVYVPMLDLAIEYQGEQHFFPLDHWGGDQGLADRLVMDERKREACRGASVRLIEWRFDEPITAEAVAVRLAAARAGA